MCRHPPTANFSIQKYMYIQFDPAILELTYVGQVVIDSYCYLGRVSGCEKSSNQNVRPDGIRETAVSKTVNVFEVASIRESSKSYMYNSLNPKLA